MAIATVVQEARSSSYHHVFLFMIHVDSKTPNSWRFCVKLPFGLQDAKAFMASAEFNCSCKAKLCRGALLALVCVPLFIGSQKQAGDLDSRAALLQVKDSREKAGTLQDMSQAKK